MPLHLRIAQLLFVACTLHAIPAWCDESPEPDAPTAAACIEYHREGQVRRRQGQLLAAAEPLARCLHPECSPLLREACGALLDEVETETPSIVLAATAEGRDLVQVSVYEGETLVADRLTGQPIQLDPGLHHFRFEAQGRKPLTRSVVLRTGETNRVVSVEWQSPPPSQTMIRPPAHSDAAPKASVSDPTDSSKEPPSRFRPSDSVPFGLGIALGTTGVLTAIAARRDFKEAQSTCSPFCSDERRKSIQAKSFIADGLFVLAGAAFTVGLVRILMRDGGEKASVALVIGPGFLGGKAEF